MRMRLAIRPNTQFATVAIQLFWTTPIQVEKLTPYALIPFVLRRGSAAYPETADLRQQFEWRYGLRTSMDLQQRGNAHVMVISMNAVDPQQVLDPNYSLEEAVRFWLTQWMHPALEAGETPAFRADYVAQEKVNIERRIASLKNDPISYASDRTARLTMRHQAQRHSIWGEAADLAKWDGAGLYQAFLEWREQATIDAYVQGNVDADAIAAIFAEWMDVERVAVDPQSGLVVEGSSPNDVNSIQKGITCDDISKWVQLAVQPQEATLFEWEQAESEQLKFNMAFELPVSRASTLFPVGMLLNGVLGGYAHSKLFQNVREKASLAYYASSRWDSLSQRLIVQSGIAPENEARTRALVLEQIQAIADEQIADDEWMQTIALLKNSMREREDDPFSWSEAMQMNRWSASRWTTTDLIAALDRVTREEVAQLASQLRLDLVYRYGKQAEDADASTSAGKAGDDNA